VGDTIKSGRGEADFSLLWVIPNSSNIFFLVTISGKVDGQLVTKSKLNRTGEMSPSLTAYYVN
jgi:hypothetical protein